MTPHPLTLSDLAARFASPLDALLRRAAEAWTPAIAVALVSLDKVDPDAAALLTPAERERHVPMSPRRRRAFVAGRIALKLLAVRWGHLDGDRPAAAVETVTPGAPHPRCGADPGAPAACSLGHDGRLAVAVAAADPVGVDVEPLAPRLRRIAAAFASPAERDLAAGSDLGDLAALARIWTIKEAVAKAAALDLPRALREVEVVALGRHASRHTCGGRAFTDHHVELGEHVVTVLVHHG